MKVVSSQTDGDCSVFGIVIDLAPSKRKTRVVIIMCILLGYTVENVLLSSDS